jgi:hypothetical protein
VLHCDADELALVGERSEHGAGQGVKETAGDASDGYIRRVSDPLLDDGPEPARGEEGGLAADRGEQLGEVGLQEINQEANYLLTVSGVRFRLIWRVWRDLNISIGGGAGTNIQSLESTQGDGIMSIT